MKDIELIKKWYSIIKASANYASIDEDKEQFETLCATLENLELFRQSDSSKIKQLETVNRNHLEEASFLKSQIELLNKVVNHLIENSNKFCSY